MDLKKITLILIGVVLVSFGIGFYSIIYIDNFRFSDYAGENAIEITDDGDVVRVGGDGIHVLDGDTSVTITWRGIEVIEGGKRTVIGIEGLRFGDGFFNNIDLINKTVDKSIEEAIPKDSLLIVKSTFADVSIEKGGTDKVVATLKGSYKGNVDLDLKVSTIPGGLEVMAVPDGNSFTISSSGLRLTVIVPEEYEGSMDVETSSASVTINELSLETLKIATSSGSVQLMDTMTDRGSVTTSSGSQTVYPAIGDFTLNSSSGSVKLTLIETSGNISAATSSGSIEVEIEGEPDYDIEARTSSGNLDYSGPGSVTKNNKDQMRVNIGDGSRSLDLETSSGSISIIAGR